MAITYHYDQKIKLKVKFRDENGALANPTTAVLTVKAPNGIETTPAVSNDGTGLRSAIVTANQEGTWHWRWTGTGGTVDGAVDEGFFHVEKTQFF